MSGNLEALSDERNNVKRAELGLHGRSDKKKAQIHQANERLQPTFFQAVSLHESG